MKVVNFLGGPGTGKSTTAAHVFAELKQRGVNCELVREYAKDVVWEGRLALLDNQIYVFAKQLKMMRDLDGKVDFIITDSPLLLTLIYCNDPLLHTLALREFNKFDNINIFLQRSKVYNPAGRVQTEDEARLIDTQIENMLNANGIPCAVFPTLVHTATDIVKGLLDD